MKKTSLLYLLVCCFCMSGFGQQILVDPDVTVERLVRDVLVNSSCAETSNYRSSTGTSFSVDGIGYFEANGSRFAYQEGIIISTGNAKDAEGPNIDIKSSGPVEWLGDNDLSEITRVSSLFNASYIEFDFIPRTNSISFNFLFASEEYSDAFQCIYSDVFAFILTDSGGNSTNLALVPDSNDRVSATSIRPGVPDNCGPRNSSFFGGINGDTSPISMTGKTKSLVAQSEVTPGETYTIKLVIADNLDAELDSAVFLQGGSFSIDVSLGDDRTVRSGNPLCQGEVFEMDATADGAAHYRWYRNGVQLPLFDDIPVVSVTEGGVYEVEVEFSASCISEGRVEIEYVDPPSIGEPPIDLNVCDFNGEGEGFVNLSENTRRLIGSQDPAIYRVYYYETREDAENFENVIGRPDNYLLTENTKTIYARLSSGRSCYEITSFTIGLRQLDFSPELEEEYLLCLDGAGNPIDPRPQMDTGLSSSEYTFAWYRTSISAENLLVSETNPFYIPSQGGIYHVVITNSMYNCETSISTSVVTSTPPTLFEVNILSDLFADNHSVSIEVEGENTYQFSVDNSPFGSQNVFSGLQPGEHIAYVQDEAGCSTISKKFFIVDYPRFFTPNGDGVNDTWKIVGLFEIENPEITIFDRYGVIQHRFNDEMGWDGTTNGNRAPSTDYWFRLSYQTKEGIPKEFKSHFTLKR